MKKILVLLVATLGMGMLAAPSCDASPATYTRAQRLARALVIMSMPLDDFDSLRIRMRLRPSGIDGTFDWTSDGCSLPAGLPSASSRDWEAIFFSPCTRHDFGYRNFGHGYYSAKSLALNPSNKMKDSVDTGLLRDEVHVCDEPGSPVDCVATAQIFYEAVHLKGSTAWTGGECTPDNLCLFADDEFHGTRWMFSVSHASMKSFDFHDKATSVTNTSDVVWLAYENEGYGGAWVCIPPGTMTGDLRDANGWNDRIDSIKRTTATHC